MIIDRMRPKVSVCVMAYNQERFIRQCLQSIVDQVTDFQFEVIVGDDCSQDGTRAIIEEFEARYPGMVKGLYQNPNVGPYKNYLDVHGMATGDYIAHMDGDDYALPGKLQTQSNYLDAHPECNLVWHRMCLENDKTGVKAEDLIDTNRLPKRGFTRADILKFMAIGLNSSKMYRREVREFAQTSFPAIDYFANVEQVGTGVASFAGCRPLGVYRVNIGIASSGHGTHICMKKTFMYFADKYPSYKKEISVAVTVLFLAALKNRNWARCRIYIQPLVKTFRLSTPFQIFKSLPIIRMLRMPSAVR